MTQGRINFYRSFKHLSKDILSYLSNTKRDEIICHLQKVVSDCNSLSNKLLGSERLEQIKGIIKELNDLNAYEKKHPNLNKAYVNRRWLLCILEFFSAASTEWHDASSPNGMFIQVVLSKLTAYDQTHPLPSGRALESLYEVLLDYAKLQVTHFAIAEKEYEAKQRELLAVKRSEPVVKEEIKKSYQPQHPPAKIDLKRTDLVKVEKILREKFKRVEGTPFNLQWLQELPFCKVSDFSFLNRDRVLLPIARKPIVKQGNFLDELKQKILAPR